MIVFKKAGLAIKLVFATIYNLILFILNNTLGLIFMKKITPFNAEVKKESLWYKIRFVLLLFLDNYDFF